MYLSLLFKFPYSSSSKKTKKVLFKGKKAHYTEWPQNDLSVAETETGGHVQSAAQLPAPALGPRRQEP